MTDLLTNFDSDRADLSKRIEAAHSIDEVVRFTDEYLSRLHRFIAGEYSLHKSRHIGYLLEIVRYAIRTLNTVDKEVLMTELQPSETRTGLFSKRFFIFIKTVQSALILALLMMLLSANPAHWIPFLLVIILVGMEIYLHFFERRNLSAARNNSDLQMPDQKPKLDIRLKITQVHAFLNCIADALSYADKVLNEQASEREGGFLENETQILKLFQDLFEAKAFQDGQWALKKISHIQAILWEHGIVVKEFEPTDSADRLSFDVEPCVDSSIRRHVTIRPAFIMGKRVLLRGRAAEPL